MRQYNEMATIKMDMSRFQIKKGGSERGEQLDKFLERLNPARIQAGYKPLNHARLGMMLAHIPTDDLHAFYRQCETANNFSKFFWWSLRAPTNEKANS